VTPNHRLANDGLGFHDLRRSSATVMVANGVSVRDAQQILGHSDPRLLLGLYAQATETGRAPPPRRRPCGSCRPAAAEAPARHPAVGRRDVGEQRRPTADAG
jgi:hypothetical protein